MKRKPVSGNPDIKELIARALLLFDGKPTVPAFAAHSRMMSIVL